VLLSWRGHVFRKEACLLLTNNACLIYRKSHFVKQCRSSKAHHIGDENSDDDKIFLIHAFRFSSSQLALITCTDNDHHNVTFEIDMDASCNILPPTDYTKARGDKNLHSQNLPHHAQGNTNG